MIGLAPISPVAYHKEQLEAQKQYEHLVTEVIRLADKGMSVYGISDECDIDVSKVRKILVPYLWNKDPRPSLQDVGNVVDCSREHVNQILHALGITERFVKKQFNDDLERQLNIEAVNQAVERYRNGEYLGNVVKDIGIPEHLVKKLRPITEDDKRHHLLSKLYRHIEIGTIPDGFDTPCLEWTGNFFGKYPRFRYGKETYVTRIMWYLEHGEWPVGVRRACKNDKCVRHLEDK